MVNTSGGRPPLHQTQMKLFNAIAAAAVLGASFIAPNPAEARNGWVYMGTMDGESNYIKPLGRSGSIASILSKWSGSEPIRVDYNCSSWQKRVGGSGQRWTPIYPGSTANTNAKLLC